MKYQQEIKFLATEAKSKLTTGKTCYQGQLQHNQTLSSPFFPQHFLYFSHEPHGHGSFRQTDRTIEMRRYQHEGKIGLQISTDEV